MSLVVAIVAIPLVIILSAVTLTMSAILAASSPINRATNRRHSADDQLNVCAEASSAVQSPAEERKFEDI